MQPSDGWVIGDRTTGPLDGREEGGLKEGERKLRRGHLTVTIGKRESEEDSFTVSLGGLSFFSWTEANAATATAATAATRRLNSGLAGNNPSSRASITCFSLGSVSFLGQSPRSNLARLNNLSPPCAKCVPRGSPRCMPSRRGHKMFVSCHIQEAHS